MTAIDIDATDVLSAAFSNDGAQLTTVSATNGIEVWDLATRSRLTYIPRHIYAH
jgi:WD40 repeat protein